MTAVPRQVANGGVCRGRLAATGFTDEPVRLAGPDLERHAAQDRPLDAADDIGQRQVLDAERGGRGRRGGGGGGAQFGGHSFRVDWSESAIRLTAMTVLAMASAGKSVGPPDPADHVRVFLADAQAPVRRRRLETDAEERQRRHGEDRVAESDGHLDDGRTEDVREDLARQDEQPRLAAKLRGGHVIELALREHGRADGPRDDRREQDPDDEDDDERRGAEDDQRQQGDEDHRQRKEGFDEAAEDVVDPATVVAHDQAQQGAGGDPEQGRQRGDDEDVARSDHDPRQDVATEPVGPEPVLRTRRQVAGGEVVERVVRRDALAEDGADDPADDDDVAEDERRAADEHTQRLATSLRPLRRGRGGHRRGRGRVDDDVDHQLFASRRMRGFIQAVRRSAASVASM